MLLKTNNVFKLNLFKHRLVNSAPISTKHLQIPMWKQALKDDTA